jgi:cardiolipin synthase
MDEPMGWWHALGLQLTFLLSVALTLVTIPWILMTKKESTSAVAWCLLVFFLPFLGFLLFLVFGYQHVHLPLKRKRKHKTQFRLSHASAPPRATPCQDDTSSRGSAWEGIARLAQHLGAFPITAGNRLTIYNEGRSALDGICQAIADARHHIHLEYFIVQPDVTGCQVLDLLTHKAKEGVEVRLLYDAMGSRRLHRESLKALLAAGGKSSVFLPLNLYRRRIQVNMRDHRKLVIVDGRIGFTGGLNIGDEYLGRNPRYGYWRDTHLRLEGPAVGSLQRVFIEDWDFAADEDLRSKTYFPEPATPGAASVQVIHSGPDQERNSIREIYFAAILRARQRLWIATPYFVPDAGLLDALCLAGYLGIDVRILCQHHPDKWIPFFAGRYYWGDMLESGAKIYQYSKGMMHSKVVLVDGEWASVGSANLDNRSLHLNFEVNCLLYSPDAVSELEKAFQQDLQAAIQLQRHVFIQRPLVGRIVENACRLLSPVL